LRGGDGPSAQEAKKQYPELFKDPFDPSSTFLGLPLRPLAGEGLHLTEKQFDDYKADILVFWNELTAALAVIFCETSKS
jgi:hypothetical protein